MIQKEMLIMSENHVAHFEIYADDPDKLQQFYTSLFDWKVQPMSQMDYRLVKTVETDDKGKPTQSGGINGGLIKRQTGFDGNAWVNYVNVKSIESTVEKAKKLGAKLTKGKTAVPGMGWFAMLMDPQQNHFAIWQTDSNAK
jgi:predicted enzyme related to lactoylglutathione lyase